MTLSSNGPQQKDVVQLLKKKIDEEEKYDLHHRRREFVLFTLVCVVTYACPVAFFTFSKEVVTRI